MNYPIGPRDEERWMALRRLDLFQSLADPGIDSLCKIVQSRFRFHNTFVTLIDKDRQWYKDHCSLEVSSTSRDVSICNYTILGNGVLVVRDTLADPRFVNHPNVVDVPFIRFYVGVPLCFENGLPLGALCAIDIQPREMSSDELVEFEHYASFVMKHLELFRTTRELNTELAKAEARRALMASHAEKLRRRAEVANQTERLAGVGGWEVELPTDRVIGSVHLSELLELPQSTHIDHQAIYGGLPLASVTRLREGFNQKHKGQGFEFDSSLTTSKGNQRWIRISGYTEFEGSTPVREIGMFHDVTQRHEDEVRLLWHATHDPLTSLPNRALLQQRLDIYATQPEQGVALMRIDIDHFKDINETFGVEAGDALLVDVGRQLGFVAPAGSTVFRLGDDEFALLLEEEVDRGTAKRVAEAILGQLRGQQTLAGSGQGCRVSIGITVLPEDGDALKAFRNAGLALQKAKTEGRENFEFFAPKLDLKAKHRVEVLRDARLALEAQRVFPFYQPKFALENRKLIGFEALMRWKGSSSEVRSPGMLAEAFDDANLAIQIGEAMLEQVVNDLSAWHSKGLRFGHVAINASAAEFRRFDYASRIFKALAARQLPTHCLEVEVTETVFLDRDAEAVRSALVELDAAGVATALDDFGTGFASLTHLRKFPVRWLKIDRSFVSELESDRNAAAIVETVIALGKAMGIGVVAEGVETQGQLEFLESRKCDQVQGFLLGKPMPAAAAMSLMQTPV